MIFFFGKKNGRTKKILPLLIWCCCWIRDPRYEMDKIRIRDKHTGSATLVISVPGTLTYWFA
jgi:hypothetical protein